MKEFTIQEKFIKDNYDAAVKVQVEYGVPLQVTLAQYAVETAWGGSKPLTENNISAIPVKKVKVRHSKDSLTGDPLYDCFRNRAFIMKRKYPVAFRYKRAPDEFIRSVQRDHEEKYSDDPQYARKIISVMALISLLVKELKLNNQYKPQGRRK
jgi:type VI secretion system secreted protein VgrG